MATETDKMLLEIIVENRQAQKNIEETFKSISKLQKISRFGGSTGPNINMKEVATAMKQAENAAKQMGEIAAKNNVNQFDSMFFGDVDKQKQESKALGDAIKQRFKEAENAAFASDKAFAKMKNNLMSVGLSMLFTGMALKKMFQDIATTATTTYNKINANTALANNAVTRLAVSMDYVYYVIGDALASALDSLMPMIISVVDTVTDWIEKNPELTGQIILWGLIISAVVMALGQLGLATLGVISALQLFGVIKVGTVISGIGAEAATASGKVSGLNTAITKLGELVLAGISISIAWAGFKEMTEGGETDDPGKLLFGTLKAALGSAFAVGFGAKLLGFGTGAAMGFGAYAFCAVIAIGAIYALSQVFKPAKDKTNIPNLGDEFDASVSTTPATLAIQQEEWSKTANEALGQYISNKEQADKNVSDWMAKQEEIQSNISATNTSIQTSVVETKSTTDDINELVGNQKLVVEDIGINATKTKENLSVLGDDDFKTTTTNITTYIGDLEKNLRKARSFDFSSAVRSQNNSLSILSR